MRALPDRVMARLARLLIHVFFRLVQVEGAASIPSDRPVVVVANHLNGLVDALLLMATLDRYPRFLGKSTLWDILPLRPFLKLAGVVPVHRAGEGASAAATATTFRTSRMLLAANGLVALFPEGISHDQSTLQPLRTGAARIALGAALDDATRGVTVVPVGLSYDAKARFRSRALVRVGPGQDMDRWADRYRRDPQQAVRSLTEELAAGLGAVSPSYRSWEQAEALAAIAAVATRPAAGSPDDVDLGRRERMAQALADVERSGTRAATMAVLRDRAEAYQRDLALLGLRDAQVAAGTGSGRYRAAVGWSVAKVIVALPAAAVGAIIHAIPYQVVKRVAARPGSEAVKATVKLLGCFSVFSVTYGVLGVIVGRRRGLLAGLAVVPVAACSGYATVLVAERALAIDGVLEGARVLRNRGGTLRSVLADRAEVVRWTAMALAPSCTGLAG